MGIGMGIGMKNGTWMIVVGGGTPKRCGGNGIGGERLVGPFTFAGIRTSPGIEFGAGVNVGIGVVVGGIWTFDSGFGEVVVDVDDVDEDEVGFGVVDVAMLVTLLGWRGLKAEMVVAIGRPAATTNKHKMKIQFKVTPKDILLVFLNLV